MAEYADWLEFLVTDLGPEDIILGLPWLRNVNPNIDWQAGTMDIGEETDPEKEGWKPGVERIAANRVQRRKWWKSC